jgi:hypothetical protein
MIFRTNVISGFSWARRWDAARNWREHNPSLLLCDKTTNIALLGMDGAIPVDNGGQLTSAKKGIRCQDS